MTCANKQLKKLLKEIEKNDYKVVKKIGDGLTSKVLLVENKKNEKVEALKLISLKRNFLKNSFFNEVNILTIIDFQHIVSINNTFEFDFQGERFGGISFDLMQTNLLEHILTKGQLPLHEAKLAFHKLCRAIQYLHSNGIAHLDIKPDNILLNLHKDDKIKDLRLCDFGGAIEISKTKKIRAKFGTEFYRPPEADLQISKKTPKYLSRKFLPKKADIWCLGATLYVMLTGLYPVFVDDNARFEFSKEFMNAKICDEFCVNLIQKLLHPVPRKRPNLKKILSHSWFSC